MDSLKNDKQKSSVSSIKYSSIHESVKEEVNDQVDHQPKQQDHDSHKNNDYVDEEERKQYMNRIATLQKIRTGKESKGLVLTSDKNIPLKKTFKTAKIATISEDFES